MSTTLMNEIRLATFQADGQGQRSTDAYLQCDRTLNKSIISQDCANRTCGKKVEAPAWSVPASRPGVGYQSEHTVRLRWWFRNASKTYVETFYVVESCGDNVECILRGDFFEDTPFTMEDERVMRPLEMSPETVVEQHQLRARKEIEERKRKEDMEAEEKKVLQERAKVKAKTQTK